MIHTYSIPVNLLPIGPNNPNPKSNPFTHNPNSLYNSNSNPNPYYSSSDAAVNTPKPPPAPLSSTLLFPMSSHPRASSAQSGTNTPGHTALCSSVQPRGSTGQATHPCPSTEQPRANHALPLGPAMHPQQGLCLIFLLAAKPHQPSHPLHNQAHHVLPSSNRMTSFTSSWITVDRRWRARTHPRPSRRDLLAVDILPLRRSLRQRAASHPVA